jgi:hypothetical protein
MKGNKEIERKPDQMRAPRDVYPGSRYSNRCSTGWESINPPSTLEDFNGYLFVEAMGGKLIRPCGRIPVVTCLRAY